MKLVFDIEREKKKQQPETHSRQWLTQYCASNAQQEAHSAPLHFSALQSTFPLLRNTAPPSQKRLVKAQEILRQAQNMSVAHTLPRTDAIHPQLKNESQI